MLKLRYSTEFVILGLSVFISMTLVARALAEEVGQAAESTSAPSEISAISESEDTKPSPSPMPVAVTTPEPTPAPVAELPPVPPVPIDDDSFESNRIDTAHYRTGKAKFEMGLSLGGPIQSISQVSQGDQLKYDNSTSSLGASATVVYGILDSLLISVSESSLFNQTTSQTDVPNGTSQGFQSDGFSNPTFHLSYRFLGGLNGRFFGSFYYDILPSWGDYKPPTPTQAGNNYSAFNFERAGLNFYWVTRLHEWFVGIEALHWLESHYDSTAATDPTSAHGLTSYSANIGYRFHFKEIFFVGLTLDFDFPSTNTYRYGNQASPYSVDDSHPFRTSPTLAFGWRAGQKTVLQLSYNYKSYTDQVTPSLTTVPTQSIKVQSQTLTVGGNWEF